MARHANYPGVYPYKTKAGTLYYFKLDGTSRRGFSSRTAAHNARLEAIGEAKKGTALVSTGGPTFGEWFETWMRQKRNLTDSTRSDYRAGFNKRLTVFADVPLRKLTRSMIADHFADLHESGEYRAHTLRNTLFMLRTCLKAAGFEGHLSTNPAEFVAPPLLEHVEQQWLRAYEIPLYLDACSSTYRPLADFLLMTGARISEAIGMRFSDLSLDQGMVRIERQLIKGVPSPTKGKQRRTVFVGAAYAARLADYAAVAAERESDPHGALLFQMPKRTAKRSKGTWAGGGPLDRTTVSRDWHKEALEDAGLRDMPLHSLRHTAAALWVSSGASLTFVQRQLGHADYQTTDRNYHHMEEGSMRTSAATAETFLADAADVVKAAA